jgi:hypothetical protein
MLVNFSASIDTAGTIDATLQDGGDSDAWLWANEEKQAVARIVASEERLTVEAWDVNLPYGANRLLHIRDARDLSRALPERRTYAVIAGGEEITGGTFYIGTADTAIRLLSVTIAFSHGTGTPDHYSILAGDVEIAVADVSYGPAEAPCAFPDSAIPAGTVFTVSVATDGGKEGLSITLEYERFS